MLVRQASRHSKRRRQEDRIFAAALGIGLLHAFDDAILNRQSGVPLTQHLPALLAVRVAAAFAVWAFPRLRPRLRSALALVAGSLMVTNGAMHVFQIAFSSMRGSDLTGVLAAAAGLALVGLGAFHPVSPSW